jgi:hypothetical protein
LRVVASEGFEVSVDGVSFATSVELAGAVRADDSSNYGDLWTSGLNGGTGFGAWSVESVQGAGLAAAYFGNPGESEVDGMGSRSFALRAEPPGSGAGITAERPLVDALGVGESFQFQWGINWDSDNDNGGKGFALGSGDALLLEVAQFSFPGQIYFNHGGTWVDTGIAYGTGPMTWSFTQVDAGTLRVTATGRGNSGVAFTQDIAVPGAVDRFWWGMAENGNDARRRSYYDNLKILPSAAGGGVLEAFVYVRLAADVPPGEVAGDLLLQSGGESLAVVALSGEVFEEPLPGGGFGDWLGERQATEELLRRYGVGGATDPEESEEPVELTMRDGRFSLTAVVRTDDEFLDVSGESVDDLGGLWSSEGVTERGAEDGVLQTGVGQGFERREYSVAVEGAGRRFLRLRVELLFEGGGGGGGGSR